MVHALVESIPFASGEEYNTIHRIEGVIVDITDRVFAERAALHRERVKTLGTVAAEVAHEIRNPHVSIGGFARRLHDRRPDLPEGAIIVRHVERLEGLLRRLLEYLRPVEVLFETCSVDEVVQSSVSVLRQEMDRSNIVCRLALMPTLTSISADRAYLQQVINDLMRNAVKAMKGGGDLSVRTYESGGNVHVEFKGEPRGAVSGDLEKLFMPFAEEDPGTGLPLSYRLLKDMGGFLSYSQEGGALVFTVSFPKGKGSDLSF
ncbi:MAG: ATP-binding protein [Pseudomonadota bacterium]